MNILNITSTSMQTRKPVALCTYSSAIGLFVIAVLVTMHRVIVASPVGVF